MSYQPLNSLDTPGERQGDADWRGFRSKPPAETLPTGIGRFAQNVRCARSEMRARAGSKAIATDLVLANPPVVLDFALPSEVVIISMTRSGSTVTVTTGPAHGFTTGNIVGIEGAAPSDYNGDWTATVTGPNEFTFNIGAATPSSPATLAHGVFVAGAGTAGANGEYPATDFDGDLPIEYTSATDYRILRVNTGSGYRWDLLGPEYDPGSGPIRNTLYRSSPPNSTAYAFTPLGLELFTIDGDEPVPTLSGGPIVCATGLRIFEIYGDRVRAACVYTDPDRTEHHLIAAGRSAFVCTQGQSSVEIAYPAGEQLDTNAPADLVPFGDYVYLFRGRAAGPELTIASLTRSSLVVTVETSTAHNLATGDFVRLPNAAEEGYRGVWPVTVADATHFEYTLAAGAPTSPSAGGGKVYRVDPPLRWDRNTANDFTVIPLGGAPEVGHIQMPPADWAVPFNDQLWLPLARNQMIRSDFNAENVYDLTALLRFKEGSPDWLMAAYAGPLTDEPGTIGPRLMVFLRKSRFLVYLNPTTLSTDAKRELPGEIGCTARHTVRTCGDYVAWLSDQGVQLANLGRDFSLLTTGRPLSADVQDLFDKRVNWGAAGNAVAAYHNNRYHLALPLDGATTNNAILVFNFLNAGPDAPWGEWESLDVYPGDFDIVQLQVADYSGRQQLHAVTSAGFVYALEIGERDEYGSPGAELGEYDIEGIFLGRRLLFGSLESKQFIVARVDLALEAAARAVVKFTTANPDVTRTLLDHTATRTGDTTFSKRPRMKGVSGAVDLFLSAGRPTVKAVSVDAVGGQGNTRQKD